MSARKRRLDVYLTGFMGAGKTSAGRLLAQRLGWEFIDLDAVIEQRTGKSVGQVFDALGEPTFRRHESDALVATVEAQAASRVIALGGGVLTTESNRKLITESGLLVLLDAPVDVLLARCQEDSAGRARPLARDERAFHRLHQERQETYRMAHLTIDTGQRSIVEVVEEIEKQLSLVDSQLSKEKHGA